jgi:hypothetical protein
VLRFLVHNVILLAGLVVCAFAGLAWRDADALAREGILATAIVVEKHEETGGKGNPLYAVTYELTVPSSDGQTIFLREKRRVSKALFDQSHIGGPIVVRYVSSDPTQNEIAGSDGGALGMTTLALCLVVIGLLDFQSWRSGSRQRNNYTQTMPRLFRRRRQATISTESLRRLQRAARKHERGW